MFISSKDRSRLCNTKYPALRKLWVRGAFLFTNFFLITMALYHLKPANKSLFIDAVGTDRLPYVWIGTALTMIIFIPFYHRMVASMSRFYVVLGSCFAASVMLFIFRILLINSNAAAAIFFYIFVDIIGVVLVEQFWSLTNTIYNTEEGKRWYGIIGTGGPVGGVIGGWCSAMLIQHTRLETPDLLLVTAGIILMLFVLTWLMGYFGIYCEEDMPEISEEYRDGWKFLGKSRYLALITAILLLSQLASPLIDFQFLKIVEEAYPEREPRTAFLSMIFSLMGLISVAVNVAVTPIIHRTLGVIAGMLVQPLVMCICSLGFIIQPTLSMSSAAKVSDRGLFNSINRASKELLYVPVNPVLIYQAKAWIDMFGFKIFKVFGSIIIILCTHWLPFVVSIRHLSWIIIAICIIWIALVIVLRGDYRVICQKYA